MDTAPWQHPTTLSYGSAAILGGKTHNTKASATIFARPRTLWLMVVP